MVKNNFNEIYKNTYPVIKNFLKHGWTLSDEDIEEITHDVLLVLHNKTISKLFIWNKSWLYKTTYNKAIDKIKNKRIVKESLELINEPSSVLLTPEENLLIKDKKEWVRNFVNKLDVINKKIAYLYYFDDMSCKSISKIIDQPTGTIKYRLFNIRKQLEKEYSTYEEN